MRFRYRYIKEKGDKKSEDNVVYYESIKRELKRRPIYEYRCDERLKTKAEVSTRFVYTGLLGGLEHLKIETRSIDEKITNASGKHKIVSSGPFGLENFCSGTKRQ